MKESFSGFPGDDEFRARLFDLVARRGLLYRKRGAMLILFSLPAVAVGFFLRSASVTEVSLIGTSLILLAGMFLFLGVMIRVASPSRPIVTVIKFIFNRAEFRHVHFVPGKGGHRVHGKIEKRYKIESDGSLNELEIKSGKDAEPDFFTPEDVYVALKQQANENDRVTLVELNGDLIGVLDGQTLISGGEIHTIAV